MSQLLVKTIEPDKFGALCEVRGEGYPHEIAHALYEAYKKKYDFIDEVIIDLLELIKNGGVCVKTPSEHYGSTEPKQSN